MSQTIIIRADASPRIGTGHMMRCLSLAQASRRTGGSAVFVSAETTAALEVRLEEAGFQRRRISATAGTPSDIQQTIDIAKAENASWVVADSYTFGFDYQRGIQAADLRLLFIDDYGHAGEYCADFILNQNLSADAALYSRRSEHTRLLLGPQYALLRDEFLQWRDWRREIRPIARKVLVTLGGSDPDNVTASVIEAVKALDIELRVLVGGSNPHFDMSSSLVTPPSLVIRDAQNIPELMAWADVAVGAGGTTSWELACMGLPSVVLVLAENQRGTAAALEHAGVARSTSTSQLTAHLADLLKDKNQRRSFSERGRRLVDGYGTSRVVTSIAGASLNLRRVRPEDCRLIWEWANEPDARAMSISTEPIEWDIHQRWFASRVNSPSCLFYIATNGKDRELGQIRFDITKDTAVVSLSLAKETRGRGVGPAVISRGSVQCFADSSVNLIRAYIKPENEASVRAFQKAGYLDDGTTEVNGHIMRQLVMNRESVL